MYHTTRREFDLAGQVIADRDKLGFWFDYEYHDRGWLTHITHPDATFTQTVYDESGNPTFDYDELGAANVIFYDELHRVSSQMDREANTFFYDYYSDGTQKEITNARGYVTHYDYDWNTLHVTVQEAYNTPRQRQTVTNLDATGNAYLATNDLLFADYVNVFEQRDWLERTEDELQHGLEYEYNNNGRVKKITDDLQHSSHFHYDALGRQHKTEDANGHTNQTIFNAHDAVVASIDGEGHAHRYVYDALDRLTHSMDAEGGVTKYSYNAEGHLLTLTDPVGNLTQWRNNWRGLPLEITDPRDKKSYKEYDAKGRLTKITDRNGRVREFEYYANDWLKQEIWKDDQGFVVNTRDFVYNEHGQLESASDNNGFYSFTYDELDRRSSQTDTHGLTLNYSYDSIDRLTQVTDSLGGTRDYEYFDNGMPKIVKFSDSNGTELRWDYAITVRNEVDIITRFSDIAGTNQIGHTDYDYEPNGLIEKISHRDSASAVIDEFTYQYNADNQVKQETSTLGSTRNFDYDATHQLISENGINFNWDANGNPTETGWIVSAGNRLDSDGTWSYEYDDEGNLLRKYTAGGEEWLYQYDVGNHLVQAQHKTSGTVDLQVDLKYDVFGNRIEKSVDADGDGPQPATVEKHAYEGGNAWADFDDNGDLTARRLYLGALDSLFARVAYATPTSVGDVAWYLTDRLGSVRDILDNTGTHQAHFDYNAFGQITVANDPNNFGDRYGFTAREWDSELGLQYTRARYYDPQIRRFISQDPLGFGAGDSNFYRYVGNNATNATDPTGEIVCGGLCIAAGIAAVAAVGFAAYTAYESYRTTGNAFDGRIWGAAGGGLDTGVRATVNSFTDMVASTFTLGFVDNLELLPVAEEDRNAYNWGYYPARVAWEIWGVVATRGLSSLGTVARVIRWMDVAQSGVLVGRGLVDMPIVTRHGGGWVRGEWTQGLFGMTDEGFGFQGVTWENALNLGMGALGLGLHAVSRRIAPRAISDRHKRHQVS